jgi:TRAP-type C4-dicarboxylate transport system substrate-binding protein
MTKHLSTFLAGTAAVALIAGFAQADTIRATSGFGPSHVLATDAYPKLFEKLGEFTDGRWDGQDTSSGLVAPNEMNTGLRDGVTELGALLLPYFVADYPESGLVTELSNLGSDNRAVSSAVTEYIVTCAECQAEFASNGQVYLGSDATPNYNFLSTTPIRTVADVQGVRIRTGSPLFTSFVESLGGVPVQMPASELFEGLSQGVLDATFSSTPELVNARLADVVTSVTEIEEGLFNGAAVTNASALLWQRMTPEDRAALAHAAQYAIADVLIGWQDTVEEAREAADAQGIEYIEPDASLVEARDAFNEKHLAEAAAILESRGVTDAQGKIDRYAALVEKWEGLIKGVESADDLAELRYQEIFSKLDYNTFGL